MIDSIKAEYLRKIKNLQFDNWVKLSLNDKNELLQWIADYMAKLYGAERICKIKIQDIDEPGKKGEFDLASKTVKINANLANNCMSWPFQREQPSNTNKLSVKETCETLFHELRHAIQVLSPANLQTGENRFNTDVECLAIYLNAQNRSNIINGYFDVYGKTDMRTQITSNLLYCLQPIERDAFIFANKVCISLNSDLHILFPDDLSFEVHDSFSNFDDIVEDAKEIFQTETPFEDIDDIIKLINGIPNERPINKLMMDAVFDTQMKSTIQAQWFKLQCKNNKDVMLQKLIDNEHKNAQIIQRNQNAEDHEQDFYDRGQ